MAEPAPERLTVAEFFILFQREEHLGRLLGLADSQEYLNLVSWLIRRNSKEV